MYYFIDTEKKKEDLLTGQAWACQVVKKRDSL